MHYVYDPTAKPSKRLTETFIYFLKWSTYHMPSTFPGKITTLIIHEQPNKITKYKYLPPAHT